MTQVIGESLPSDVNFSLPTEKLNGFVFSEDISWASALRKIYAASQEAILRASAGMAVSRNGDGRSRIGCDIDVMTSRTLPKKKKSIEI